MSAGGDVFGRGPRRLPVFDAGATESPVLIGLPSPLATREGLHLPDSGDLPPRVRAILVGVRDALARGRGEVFALDGLDARERAELWDMLGQGEVSIVVQGTSRYEIEETSLPGVFRVRTIRADGDALHLEVGLVPAVVKVAAEHGTSPELPIVAPPSGLMNALPLVVELAHRMKTHAPGDPNHVVSLTLLPLNDEDGAFLARSLGAGPVRAESRGYGKCRAALTARRGIWSVQYFNAMDTMILDTLEVGGVPDAILAAPTDLEDSAARLSELLQLAESP